MTARCWSTATNPLPQAMSPSLPTPPSAAPAPSVETPPSPPAASLSSTSAPPPPAMTRWTLAAGKTLTFSGASTLTITTSGGATPGIYTLVTGGNNITGVAPATLNLPVGWAATVSISGNNLLLNVTSTGGPGPVDHFAISVHPLAANRRHADHRHHHHRARMPPTPPPPASPAPSPSAAPAASPAPRPASSPAFSPASA